MSHTVDQNQRKFQKGCKKLFVQDKSYFGDEPIVSPEMIKKSKAFELFSKPKAKKRNNKNQKHHPSGNPGRNIDSPIERSGLLELVDAYNNVTKASKKKAKHLVLKSSKHSLDQADERTIEDCIGPENDKQTERRSKQKRSEKEDCDSSFVDVENTESEPSETTLSQMQGHHEEWTSFSQNNIAANSEVTLKRKLEQKEAENDSIDTGSCQSSDITEAADLLPLINKKMKQSVHEQVLSPIKRPSLHGILSNSSETASMEDSKIMGKVKKTKKVKFAVNPAGESPSQKWLLEQISPSRSICTSEAPSKQSSDTVSGSFVFSLNDSDGNEENEAHNRKKKQKAQFHKKLRREEAALLKQDVIKPSTERNPVKQASDQMLENQVMVSSTHAGDTVKDSLKSEKRRKKYMKIRLLEDSEGDESQSSLERINLDVPIEGTFSQDQADMEPSLSKKKKKKAGNCKKIRKRDRSPEPSDTAVNALESKIVKKRVQFSMEDTDDNGTSQIPPDKVLNSPWMSRDSNGTFSTGSEEILTFATDINTKEIVKDKRCGHTEGVEVLSDAKEPIACKSFLQVSPQKTLHSNLRTNDAKSSLNSSKCPSPTSSLSDSSGEESNFSEDNVTTIQGRGNLKGLTQKLSKKVGQEEYTTKDHWPQSGSSESVDILATSQEDIKDIHAESRSVPSGSSAKQSSPQRKLRNRLLSRTCSIPSENSSEQLIGSPKVQCLKPEKELRESPEKIAEQKKPSRHSSLSLANEQDESDVEQKKKKNVVKKPKETRSLSESKFKCTRCHKHFRNASIMMRHDCKLVKSRVKPPSPKKKKAPHVCDECGRTYLHRCHLNHHVRTAHLGYRPYKCDMCEMSFGEKQTLVVHSRTHSGSRPYKCNFCSRSFLTTSNLHEHYKGRHNLLQKYHCGFCEVSYYFESDLLAHKSAIHSKKQISVTKQLT